ncbi:MULTISPECIES: hypothetical protein [unclassified Streptomyces]|uniref:hypothetical protein n=1 Tax=unclassified Streptomyces TaxID=2593676 RepID=UPI0038002B14
MAIFKFGNVTVESDSADAPDFKAATEQNGGAINGGVYGGVNHGIEGGVFHGRIVIGTDDE